VTDGRRQYFREAVRSFVEQCRYPFHEVIVVNDSGEQSWAAEINGLDIENLHPIHHEQRRGLAAAVNTGFSSISRDTDYVFWLEEDFVFVEPVDINSMALVLDRTPHLAQVSLKRQPWAPIEIEHGGYMEVQPDLYAQEHLGVHDVLFWCEHAVTFTLNPCLFPRWVADRGWPEHGTEGDFTASLLAGRPWTRFAVWGERTDPPRVLHIGGQRSSGWVV